MIPNRKWLFFVAACWQINNHFYRVVVVVLFRGEKSCSERYGKKSTWKKRNFLKKRVNNNVWMFNLNKTNLLFSVCLQWEINIFEFVWHIVFILKSFLAACMWGILMHQFYCKKISIKINYWTEAKKKKKMKMCQLQIEKS